MKNFIIDRLEEYSDEALIEEIRRVAKEMNGKSLSQSHFNKVSRTSSNTLRRRFGNWKNALDRAGLEVRAHGKRYSGEECYENLLKVWTYFGRPPKYLEMRNPPSTVGPKAYIKRWNTWNKALHAFYKRVASGEKYISKNLLSNKFENEGIKPAKIPESERRDIRLGLRYKILKRDNFKCVKCGRSPASNPRIQLQVDHVLSFSKGGKTVEGNLQTTCADCNQGKGDSQ
ncbi:hypothetical protein MNBD_NITROSPINAE04-687 [hydrothermal vent metagenome]|uniref:HNH nuclease domain-containing protein n=1 Tax=hydrothermal vent metagenome TaxID=652676 RepID=A0A3B1C865_9ZZZZ